MDNNSIYHIQFYSPDWLPQIEALANQFSIPQEAVVLTIDGYDVGISLTGQWEKIHEISQRLLELKSSDQVTLKQVYAKLLNTNEKQIPLNELYLNFQQFFNASTHFLSKKETKSSSFFVDFTPPSFFDRRYTNLTTEIKKEREIINQLYEVQNKINADDVNTMTDTPYLDVKVIHLFEKVVASVASLEKKRLDQQLTQQKVKILNLMFELHQQIPVLTELEQNKANARLEHMLELATVTNHMAYVSELVKGGAKPTLFNVYMAVIANLPHMIERLAQLGIQIDTPNKIGWTVLRTACLRGQKAKEALEMLIKLGADLENQAAADKRSPIHEAILSDLNNEDVIHLLKKVHHLNLTDANGDSLLHEAIKRLRYIPDESYSILNYLLKSDTINPNAQNKEGQTPLHVAINWLKGKKALETVRLLLRAGAYVLVEDVKGQTALHYAAKESSQLKRGEQDPVKLIELLLKHGAQVNKKDHQEQTALHKALRYDSLESNRKTILTLIQAGANLDVQDFEGNTPLHLAVWLESVERVKILLEHGANRHLCNKKGQLPSAAAMIPDGISKKKMTKILELLSQAYLDVSTESIAKKRQQNVNELLDE